MTSSQNIFLEELLRSVDAMIETIEEREVMTEDLSVARELADQLRDEVESLLD